MTVQLSDEEIGLLLGEEKILPGDFQSRIRLRSKRGHKESEHQVIGEKGHTFLIKFRQNEKNALDFSVILLYLPDGSNRYFRLRRYNGKSHEHTNKIERDTFYGFHIHTATLRYQQMGYDEDAYAESSARYADFTSATGCMLKDCGFTIPSPNATLSTWGV